MWTSQWFASNSQDLASSAVDLCCAAQKAKFQCHLLWNSSTSTLLSWISLLMSHFGTKRNGGSSSWCFWPDLLIRHEALTIVIALCGKKTQDRINDVRLRWIHSWLRGAGSFVVPVRLQGWQRLLSRLWSSTSGLTGGSRVTVTMTAL